MRKIAKVLLIILFGILIYSFITSETKTSFQLFRSPLKDAVEKSMESVKGRYGIYIKSLKSDDHYFSNENQIFESGSLYKLWVMEKVYKGISEGKLDSDELLADTIQNLNNKFSISSQEAELKEGNIDMTVSEALTQMITISHNYAAMLLLQKVGKEAVPTNVSPKQVAEFFERLYKNELINPEYSGKMLELLSNQKINDRIPKLLPAGVRVAHKTADLGFFEHDGGIVYTPKGDYIFVVLSESEMPDAAGKRIAELSKAVFDYFSR